MCKYVVAEGKDVVTAGQWRTFIRIFGPQDHCVLRVPSAWIFTCLLAHTVLCDSLSRWLARHVPLVLLHRTGGVAHPRASQGMRSSSHYGGYRHSDCLPSHAKGPNQFTAVYNVDGTIWKKRIWYRWVLGAIHLRVERSGKIFSTQDDQKYQSLRDAFLAIISANECTPTHLSHYQAIQACATVAYVRRRAQTEVQKVDEKTTKKYED